MKHNEKEKSVYHPKGFVCLFLTEMGERFAFYTLSSLFVLYLTHQMMLPDEVAYSIYFTFSALLFVMPPLGGYVAERYLNCHIALVMGAVILCVGYAIIAIGSMHAFYMGLSMIVVGQGFFKSMPYLILGKMHAGQAKSIMDSRYTKYYLSINIGGIPALMCGGVIAQHFGYGVAYGIASVGMAIAVCTFVMMFVFIKAAVSDDQKASVSSIMLISMASIIVVAIVDYFISHSHQVSVAVIAASIAIIAYVIKCSIRLDEKDRKNVFYLMMLIGLSVVFFTFWNQQPTSLSLYIDRNVSHHMFGMTIPTSSFWLFNPFWIVLMSPVMVWLYQKEFAIVHSTQAKYMMGLVLTSASYWVIVIACRYFSEGGIISGYWIALSYGLLAIGELLISALGASLVVRYAPASMRGFMMGVWFFASS